MQEPNFSVVLIARNEGKTLPRLMESLKQFKRLGGQVILVDTGSTDDTVTVANSFGCEVTEVGDRFRRVIGKEEAGCINARFVLGHLGEKDVVTEGDSLFDYASARNFAASLAKNDMVAMPDCDEVYTQLDLEKLCALIENGAEQLEYEFVFSHDKYGNPAIAFKHCKFYNRNKLRWVGIIHEVLQGNAQRTYADETVIKLEHWQNHETDRSGYLRGLALDCYENPDNDRNSHYFGRELFWTGRSHSAIRELIRHVDMNRWPAERAQSCIYIGDAYLSLGQEENALTWYHRANIIDGQRRVPFMRLADYYFRRNDPKRVVTYAEAALTVPKGNFYSEEAAHYRHAPHELLYWAYWYTGDHAKSKEHFEIARSFMPNHSKYLFDQRFYEDLPTVTVVLPQLGREESFQRACKSVEGLIYPKEKLEFLVEDGEGTVPNKVAKMYAASKGEWIVFASNDIEFTPESLMIALNYAREEGVGLVAFNTGKVLEDEGNICEHFVIRRDLVEQIGGEIFNTRFRHVGVDNLLWAQCRKLGQAVRCDEAIVHHYHFSTKKSEFDEVYKKGWEQAAADRALLKEELLKLNS